MGENAAPFAHLSRLRPPILPRETVESVGCSGTKSHGKDTALAENLRVKWRLLKETQLLESFKELERLWDLCHIAKEERDSVINEMEESKF